MRRGLFSSLAVVVLAAALVTAGASSAAAASPIPVLAYYYIWYTPSAWSKGKSDYPLLGRYSSNNADVMRQHVEWAESAGIDGFIVSWKNTPALDARLRTLIKVADSQNFKLAIIYEGLNYSRKPLRTQRVAADLRYFVSHFASDPAFEIYSKPLVVWSGTWMFTREQVQQVVTRVRGRVLVLASEKSVKGYQRLADVVDGDAYYWSSVDPQTFPGYPKKLIQMSDVVHKHLGLWIAPAAPGFDARLVGGHIVVPRRGGKTLREELSGAEASSPDAIGLISWNEFSENSAIEPSTRYGKQSLNTLAAALGGKLPAIQDFSSDNAARGSRVYGPFVAAGAGACLLALLAFVVVRTRRSRRIVRPRRRQPGLED